MRKCKFCGKEYVFLPTPRVPGTGKCFQPSEERIDICPDCLEKEIMKISNELFNKKHSPLGTERK